jgi:hypothetical protein
MEWRWKRDGGKEEPVTGPCICQECGMRFAQPSPALVRPRCDGCGGRLVEEKEKGG